MIVSGFVHYARDRSSFTRYREIEATLQGVPVIGIGTVKLEVYPSPRARQLAENELPHNRRDLVLVGVLHIPSSLCNGFRITGVMGDNYEVTERGGISQAYDKCGRPAWYGESFMGLKKLALWDSPQGVTLLDGDGLKFLSIYPNDDELELFNIFYTSSLGCCWTLKER